MSASVSQIIRNTGFLYVRMLVTMAIMLYTSRVLLDVLGTSDYGLYHVLAGVVILMGFLQGALSSATQRFIAVELGRGSTQQLSQIFSMSVNIHALLGLVIAALAVFLAQVWLLDVIDIGANDSQLVYWVFVVSIVTFVFNLMVLPCHAVVIAHERMQVFAWFGIAEALLKLAIVFLIPTLDLHPLLAYAMLLCGVSLALLLGYFVYIRLAFTTLRYQRFWSKEWFMTLVSFSGWTIWGSAASVFANQGSNLLLNIFFGPALNAAKSIGQQASGALNQFVTNLQAAINPQLIKSYSAENTSYTDKLIYHGAKYNVFLISLLALPVFTFTEAILQLWLVEVPEYAALFLRILLVTVVIESISRPLITAAQATGRIKLYQLVVGGILLLNIPLSYVALKQGAGPASVFYIALAVVVLSALARVIMLKRIYHFSARRFGWQVLWPVMKVSLALWGCSQAALWLWPEPTVWQLLLATIVLLSACLVVIVTFGLATTERSFIWAMLSKFRKGN